MRKASLLVLFLTVFIDLIGFGMVIPFLSFYARESGEIRVPQLRQTGVDVRLGPIGVAQHHARDLRIGAAGQIVAPEIAPITVHRLERHPERIARRTPVGEQRAVDVEED